MEVELKEIAAGDSVGIDSYHVKGTFSIFGLFWCCFWEVLLNYWFIFAVLSSMWRILLNLNF
jgi:hypothetical protein